MIVKLIVQTFISFGAMGILLFLAAGTFAWPGAWAFLVLMVALSFALGINLARHDPGLLGTGPALASVKRAILPIRW